MPVRTDERPVSVVRARHFVSVPDLVVGGQLVAIVPEMHAQMVCARSPRLAMWPVPLRVPPDEVGIVWHTATDTDAAQNWLRERVLRLFRRRPTRRAKERGG